MRLLSALFVAIFGVSEFASAQLLPKGIGAYSLGYRQYSPDSYYDEKGSFRNMGEKMDVEFTGPELAAGKGGSDFRRLYREIKKFDSQGATDSLADQMSFGQITGDVKADVNAKFFGMGYGLSDDITIFGGLPFVTASVNTSLSYSGSNNANEIRSKLGNLVYKEIQDGLNRAASLSAETVRSTIENDKGYKSMSHWDYSGIGDVQLGARTEKRGRGSLRPFSLGLSGQLDLPTGHADDPDNLIDIPVGRGYTALTVGTDAKASYGYFSLGVKDFFTQGMSGKVIRRVPVDGDTVVYADRRSSVNWVPGREVGAAGYATLGNSLVTGTYALGTKRHYTDKYSGSLEGEYDLLSEGTNRSEVFQELSATLTTVNAYASKKFAIPFIMNFVAHQSIAGVNVDKVQYFELSITSFFQTPAAAKTTAAKEDKAKDREKLPPHNMKRSVTAR